LTEAGRRSDARRDEKQLAHRLPPEFVHLILDQFNEGELDAESAAGHLGVGRSRLYELRTDWLRDRGAHRPKASGGDRRGLWPERVHRFLEEFLPIQSPPNYQLVADEMEDRFGFKRARSTVAAYVKRHFGHLIPAPVRKPQARRRFRRARIGELWQHDSSIHQWWPGPKKQTLLLTVDDCSGLAVAGSFVESDTTWNHFGHFRQAIETRGLPQIIYTDGLSLFGHSSVHDRGDPKSQFQRALLGLGVAHLVAPTPQAKGKIERRFGTFQRRLVTLLAYAGATDWLRAGEVLQKEIARQNRRVTRSTGKVPADVWEEQMLAGKGRIRACPPPSLLDLHFSLSCTRRVNSDSTVDFEGSSYEITPTARKRVTILYHPGSRFWVLEHKPEKIWPPILGAFTL
jgi:hypothetical protein